MRDDAPHALPTGWVDAQLSEVCEVNPPTGIDGLSPKSCFSFVPMAAVAEESGAIDLSVQRELAEVAKGYTRFRNGDVLFAKITPCMENGKIAVAANLANGLGFGSTEFHVLRPRIGISARYVFYFVLRRDFRNEARHRMKGTAGQKRVPADVLHQAAIPVPPSAEQERIVARIDELFSDIDAGVANLKRAQALLKRYRQSVLNAAVTGELFDSFKVKRARWPLPPHVPSRYQRLPDGWRYVELSTLLAGIDAGKNFRCIERPPAGGELGVVKVSAVTWGTFDENESKTVPDGISIRERDLIRPGDFLISRANTLELVGACVIAGQFKRRLLLSDKILRLRFENDVGYWVKAVLRSPLGRAQIEALASGNQVSMRNITQENLGRIMIPMPPEAVRIRLEAAIETALTGAERLKTTVAMESQRSEAARQSILRAAFSGKLVPQNPADEPAGALLERIRTARAAEGVDGPRRRSGRRRAAV